MDALLWPPPKIVISMVNLFEPKRSPSQSRPGSAGVKPLCTRDVVKGTTLEAPSARPSVLFVTGATTRGTMRQWPQQKS